MVTPTGIAPADVLIVDGVIADLAPPGSGAQTAEVLDATGCIVMPGVIDAHVHFRTPGLTHKEDWEHASAAAVAGGVTTVFDMPNTVPATATAQALAAKLALVAGRSWCHFGFYGALAADNLAHLEALARGGAIGFKVFLGETTASLPPPDDGQLLQAWSRTKALGLRTMVHAENTAILQMAATIVAAQGIRDLRAHGLSRPAVAEVEAIARACLLAAEAGAGICIAHVSTAGGAAALRRAKADGVDVRGETCPHYLLLTEAEAMELGPVAKVNPPLRADGDRAGLWAAVADGTIDQVGSDHAPHTAEEKAAGVEDIRRAPSGFAGVQSSLSLLCAEPRLPPRRLVELLCEGPARTWGLWPRKGRIARGADADLAVIRVGEATAATWPAQWSLHPDGPLMRLRSPRAGAVATVVGGRLAFAGGQVIGKPLGAWVRGGG